MALPNKVTVTPINDGDPVNPSTANQPHLDLEDSIDNIIAHIASSSVSFFDNDVDNTTALNFGYFGGNYRENNTVVAIATATIALTASSTNYIEINKSGVVVHNTTGFTRGSIPLWEAVTDGASITSITDRRTWVTSTDAENLNLTTTALTATNVKAGIEEAVGNAIAMSVVFGG